MASTMAQQRLQSHIFDPFVAPESSTQRIPGSHEINQARSPNAPVRAGSPTRTVVSFDPILSQVIWTDDAPALPPVTDSLNPYRRLDSRQKDKE